MILNTGARTDTVQYFSEWLLKRFEECYVYTRNPLFPNKVTKYELSPDKIDSVMFCSKNYKPILPRLHEITDKYRTYFHYTITAYGKDIEPGVPSIDESIETNMPEIIPLGDSDKNKIAEILGMISNKYGIHIQTCGTNGDYSGFGIHSSGCATLEILGAANNCEFKDLKHKGLREGCHCIESRDIGAYDTCLNGCKYCYANKSPQKARGNYKFHNPASPLLLGELKPTDEVMQGNQTSFLKSAGRQLSLFDGEDKQ